MATSLNHSLNHLNGLNSIASVLNSVFKVKSWHAGCDALENDLDSTDVKWFIINDQNLSFLLYDINLGVHVLIYWLGCYIRRRPIRQVSKDVEWKLMIEVQTDLVDIQLVLDCVFVHRVNWFWSILFFNHNYWIRLLDFDGDFNGLGHNLRVCKVVVKLEPKHKS